jgi:MerR family transcriptional regulator, thiopeptide resistance regulator
VYTVKQLAEMAGVTVRTLHHYDEIALLKPSQVGANSYRYYDEEAVLRLQQILFYRELGLELTQIKDILDAPDFDYVRALESHRTALQARAKRLDTLIETVDDTIRHLKGEITMSNRKIFQGLTPEQEEDNTRAARLQYDRQIVNESARKWKDYSAAQKQAIFDEGNAIYDDLARALDAGTPATDESVQAIFVRWHNHLLYFYEPTMEILRGLGELYRTDPGFIANFQKLHADLPDYLHAGIEQYVDDLETAEIARMLADDEEKRDAR